MKPDLSRVIKNTRRTIGKHSPEILTAIGIAGMATSVVLAVKATPKAMDILEGDESLTKRDVVRLTWKCYVPAASSFIFAGVCLIGANSVNAKRNTALAAAYKLSEKALIEYRDAVVETIGENAEKEVRDKVDKKRLEENPVSSSEVIITGGGEVLCFEHISGRHFMADVESIRSAENTVNKQILHYNYASLSDFYDELGLDHTAISDRMGWNLDTGLLEITFGSQIAENGKPCLVINYNRPPQYDFDRFG